MGRHPSGQRVRRSRARGPTARSSDLRKKAEMTYTDWTLLIVTAVVALGLLGLDRRAERKQREADAEAYRRVLAKQDLARDAQITRLRDWQQPAAKGIRS